MRGSAKFLLGACAAGLLATGCDWRDFDTLQNQAPVLRIDPPSGFPSAGDFGNVILPVAPPMDGSTAAWFLASGTESLGLALVKVDASGGSSAQTLSGQAIDDLNGDPVTAMAEIPGTSGTALLGAPTAGKLLTLEMETATVTPFVPASTASSSEELFGNGVAAGNLTGGAAADLVVASDTSIHVFIGGSTTGISPGPADLGACPIALVGNVSTHDLQTRAVVIGNLLGGPVIAIGTPGAGVQGTVSFFIVAGGVVSCAGVLSAPTLTTPPATMNSGFGAALAIGDFDGDGVSDLLVGAPPYAVYLYKGPLTLPGSAPTATILPPQGNANFGYALAAMVLDGKLGDPAQALVGDPGATVDGQTDAGNVTIYTGPTLAMMAAPTPVLTDHESAAGEGYGTAIAVLPFCAVAPCTTDTLLPLVGASSRIFTYFKLGSVDPRTK